MDRNRRTFRRLALLRLHQIISGAEGKDDADVGMVYDKIRQGARLRLAHLMPAGPRRKELVVVRKIPIEVHAAWTVFVPGLVTVVVTSFAEPAPSADLALGSV